MSRNFEHISSTLRFWQPIKSWKTFPTFTQKLGGVIGSSEAATHARAKLSSSFSDHFILLEANGFEWMQKKCVIAWEKKRTNCMSTFNRKCGIYRRSLICLKGNNNNNNNKVSVTKNLTVAKHQPIAISVWFRWTHNEPSRPRSIGIVCTVVVVVVVHIYHNPSRALYTIWPYIQGTLN